MSVVAALTMGVEEEFYLVEAAGELVQEAAGTVDDADETADDEPGMHADLDLKPELLRCQVESGSEICRDHDALVADLTGLRARLSDAAAQHGARLLPSGTTVTAPRDPQQVAAGRRYRRIVGHVGRFWSTKRPAAATCMSGWTVERSPSRSATTCGPGCRRCSRCRPTRRSTAGSTPATPAHGTCCGHAGRPRGHRPIWTPRNTTR